MKSAIWGTGLLAAEFFCTLREEDVLFFIDNDRKKCEKLFAGKKVIHPEDIIDWEGLSLYIPYNFYDEIVEQLIGYGVDKLVHIHKYYEKNPIVYKKFLSDYKGSQVMLQSRMQQMTDSCIFWGRMWSFEDKGYIKFIRELHDRNKNLKMGIVSEAIWYTQEQTENILGLPSVVTPSIFDMHTYVKSIEWDEEFKKFVYQKKCGDYGIKFLQAAIPDLNEKEACTMIYYMYQYVISAMNIFHPSIVVVYTFLCPQHRILEEECMQRGTSIISTHQGVLPGTLSFDIGGEMGKSLPAVYSDKFRKLPVNETDLRKAQEVWNFLYKSKLNRKKQQKNNCIEYVKENIVQGKPIVFFAGQNDIDSCMVPYTEETRKYHSPVFQSSIEAGIYLAKLCEKNDWNFVYKPHPMATRYDDANKLPKNTIYVEFGNINDLIDISDVVVTILSQTNYISLIRHKPVVMLGYNQTKGKGCTYEAFEKGLIEGTIREALEKGFTKEQETAFLKHIAQLIKYYLYDDGMERELRFGREVPTNIEEFYELEKLMKESEEAG